MDVQLGIVVMALELVSTLKRLFGSNVPEGNTDQLRMRDVLGMCTY